MHPFQYVAARSVDEVVGVLTEHGQRARCMAGGTDILAQTRGGRFDLDVLVDLKGVPETTELRFGPDGLYLGASVPCYRIYEDPAVAAAYPGIIDAASLIGGIQIQSRASLGGNLCNASPSADGICPLIVHSATAHIAGPNGRRSVPVEEFSSAPGLTVLGNGEFLIGLDLPRPTSGFGAAYERFIPRNEMDIAVVGVASSITVNAGGTVQAARIALAAVGPVPILAHRAAGSLIGKQADASAFEAASTLAAQEATPISDMRGDVEFRRTLVRVLAQRTLTKALDRAGHSN